MGGKTPETCWAINKRQDNKLKNCCVWLVIYLNCSKCVIRDTVSCWHCAAAVSDRWMSVECCWNDADCRSKIVCSKTSRKCAVLSPRPTPTWPDLALNAVRHRKASAIRRRSRGASRRPRRTLFLCSSLCRPVNLFKTVAFSLLTTIPNTAIPLIYWYIC